MMINKLAKIGAMARFIPAWHTSYQIKLLGLLLPARFKMSLQVMDDK